MDPYAFKYEAARELIDQRGTCRVVCDGRHPDIDLPSELWESPRVELQLGRRSGSRDLRLHPITGISGTLSFGGLPYHCSLPWASIYVIGPHVWFGEVPADARKHFEPPPQLRSALRLITPIDQNPTPNGGGPHAA